MKKKFISSPEYWENRYRNGGNSGVGSYNEIAEYKQKIINEFVEKNNIQSVIEFGSGDGNQLSLANYKSYIGLDVSKTAINICNKKFHNDLSKSFFIYNSLAFFDNHSIFNAELALSLDVIYHLVENDIYEKYMLHLFNAAQKYIIIYSNNNSNWGKNHIKSRVFTDWVEKNKNEWNLDKIIKNEKFNWQDFYIYKKK